MIREKDVLILSLGWIVSNDAGDCYLNLPIVKPRLESPKAAFGMNQITREVKPKKTEELAIKNEKQYGVYCTTSQQPRRP